MPQPSNDNRPASFDNQLLAYTPALKKLALKLLPTSPHHEREDLLQATLLRAIERWQSYRPGNSPYTWLQFLMRGINNDSRDRAKTAAKYRPELMHSAQRRTQPNQEHATDVSLVLSRTPRHRLNDLVAVGLGASFTEIAHSTGVSPCRARERVLLGRRAMERAANDADAAWCADTRRVLAA